MSYFFKRKNETLINIRKINNDPLLLEVNTCNTSKVYEDSNKFYINIEINEYMRNILKDIQEQSEIYIQNNYKYNSKFKTSLINDNEMKVKLVKNKLDILNYDNKRITIYELSNNQQISLTLHLEFIWINDFKWGFSWKTHHIKVSNEI